MLCYSPPALKGPGDLKDSLQYANVGFQFVASIALGYWGGGWAGRRWGLTWAENTGLVLGLVAGLWMLIKAGLEWDKRDKRGPGSSS